jgi:hypothetical protein
LTTKYVSDTQVTIVVPAFLLLKPVDAQLFVINVDILSWSDGYTGYPISNGAAFSVTAPVRGEATTSR